MKSTNIPAQIINVEDRVTANLSVHQLLILLAAIPINLAFFIVVPAFLRLNIFKDMTMLLTIVICIFLSLRYQDQIMLRWLIKLMSYYLRPKHYVYSKKSLYLRSNYQEKVHSITKLDKAKSMPFSVKKSNNPIDKKHYNQLLNNPSIKFSFVNNSRGKLHVYISEN